MARNHWGNEGSPLRGVVAGDRRGNEGECFEGSGGWQSLGQDESSALRGVGAGITVVANYNSMGRVCLLRVMKASEK